MMIFVVWLLLQAALTASKCPAGSVQGLTSDDCYEFSGALSWMEAEEMCGNRGGHLASASNAFVNALLTLPVKQVCAYADGSHQYWIGASIGVLSTNWSWSDGTPFVYQNWAKGNASTGDNEVRCTVIDATSSYWSSLECMQEKPFICRFTGQDDVAATTERPPKTTCPSEWTYFAPSKKCYKLAFNVSFNDALDYCQRNGGTLASVHSGEENDFLSDFATTNYKDATMGVYLGLQGSKKNGYHWHDGSPFDYANWAKGQPDGCGYDACNEDTLCGYMYTGYSPPKLWDDAECYKVWRAGICQQNANF